jgi:hypothetical protein
MSGLFSAAKYLSKEYGSKHSTTFAPRNKANLLSHEIADDSEQRHPGFTFHIRDPFPREERKIVIL